MKKIGTNKDAMDIKKITAKIKLLTENDDKRRNQYLTIFREFKKIKQRVQFLESERYSKNQEVEKHFDHLEDELINMQSHLDFFTGEGEGEITGHEEVKEEKEEVKPKRLIMGLDFSDWKLLPQNTKTK